MSVVPLRLRILRVEEGDGGRLTLTLGRGELVHTSYRALDWAMPMAGDMLLIWPDGYRTIVDGGRGHK
jgi:hypothetical protein